MIKNWKQFNESRQLDFFEGTPYEHPNLVEKGKKDTMIGVITLI